MKPVTKEKKKDHNFQKKKTKKDHAQPWVPDLKEKIRRPLYIVGHTLSARSMFGCLTTLSLVQATKQACPLFVSLCYNLKGHYLV